MTAISDDLMLALSQLRDLTLAPRNREMVALARYRDMPKLGKPGDYHEKIKIIQGYYHKDPLFGSLVDMVTSYAADGHEWEVPMRNQSASILQKMVSKLKGGFQLDSEKDEQVWREWDSELNTEINNVLPGTGEVDSWIMKKLQLTGMCALTWKYGTIKPGDGRNRDYTMPVIMVNWPSESVRLERPDRWDKPESFLLKLPDEPDANRGEQNAVLEAETGDVKIDGKKYRRQMSVADHDPEFGSFVIKYNWSPGEVSIVDGEGEVEIHRGLYPDPPYERLIPALMLRESLFSSDLAILDGLINMIMMWVIGTEKYDPKAQQKNKDGTVIRESDVTIVKDMLKNQDVKQVLEVFLPYWVELKWSAPPTDTLMDAKKYIQATIEILQCFGIFDEDRSFFKQLILNYRNKALIPYWRVVTTDVVERNNGNLGAPPNRRYAPLPFDREEIIDSINKSHERGELSTETLHRFLGINPAVERGRLQKEYLSGDRDIYNEMVPIQFSQDVVKPGGKVTKETTKKTGRPSGEKDKSDRKERSDAKKT